VQVFGSHCTFQNFCLDIQQAGVSMTIIDFDVKVLSAVVISEWRSRREMSTVIKQDALATDRNLF